MAATCRNICDYWPSAGKTGYYEGVKYCARCSRFLSFDGVFCLCCGGNLRGGPMDKREKDKRKTNII